MRFQIDLEGVVSGVAAATLDEALDAAMEALLLGAGADPSVGGTLATGRVEVSFVIEALTTEQALVWAHDLVREVTTHEGWNGVTWEIARAEALHAADRASV